MTDRLIVDECLTPDLVPIAHEAGFEAYHVAYFGLSGRADHIVFETVASGGFIFVTNDREDWRTLFSTTDLHAGLIVILPNCRRDAQKTLFRAALNRVKEIGGLDNKVLEINANGEIAVSSLGRIMGCEEENIALAAR